jgi:hypothetical protein
VAGFVEPRAVTTSIKDMAALKPTLTSSHSLSLPAYVIAEQGVLITQIKTPVCDHGIRPRGGSASVRLLESAFLYIAFGGCLHEAHRAALATADQEAIRVGDRTLPTLRSDHIICRFSTPGMSITVIEPVQVVPHQHHAAMVVLHLPGEVDLFGFYAAGAVAARSQLARPPPFW